MGIRGSDLGRREARVASASISVLIVDDHDMVADALRQALDRVDGLSVIGRAGTVSDGVRMARDRRPDVALMDYHLPDGNGADATRQLLEYAPNLVVIMLTGSGDAPTASAGLEAGCMGFVTKDASVSELVRSIRRAAAGEIVVPTDLLPSLVARARPSRPTIGDDLTDREREVLALLALGSSTDEIVDQLVLSSHTVRNHIRNVLTKLDAHSRLEAVTIASRVGIVTLAKEY